MNDLTTQDYNRMIADILIASIEKYPDWNFAQHLRNLEIIKELRNEKDEVVAWRNEAGLHSAEVLLRVGNYKTVLERLGAYVKDNAKLAAKRLKVDDHSQRVKAAKESKELRK